VTAVFGRKNFAKNKKAESLYITRISAFFVFMRMPLKQIPLKKHLFFSISRLPKE